MERMRVAGTGRDQFPQGSHWDWRRKAVSILLQFSFHAFLVVKRFLFPGLNVQANNVIGYFFALRQGLRDFLV